MGHLSNDDERRNYEKRCLYGTEPSLFRFYPELDQDHCVSCHEDEAAGHPMCTIDVAGSEYEVCCAVARLWRAKKGEE